jgi:hypothetical protein
MRFYLAFIGIFICNIAFAQATFQITLGGSQEEFGYAIQKTRNNGFICAGRTFSFGTGGWECYLIRINSQGDTVWTKTYGNVLYDEFQDVDTTSDGGFIAVGHTTTTDFASNVYLIKTDSNGVHQWSKEYGGANGLSDKGYSVSQTSDGGYIISGTTASFGSGGDDMYVIKTTSTGSISWTSVIGTAGVNEAGREIQQTSDGGYIVAGYTDGIGQSFYDVLLVKINATGVVQWKKTYGGSSYDFAYTVQQTTDNGFIVGATTNSFGAGNWDAYLIKTDGSGNLQWSKTYGLSGEDRAQSARQTADGGYVLCGRSSSFGFGSFDAVLYKTDANGNLSWTKAYGGLGDDQAFYAREISTNNYILCGYTVSNGAGIKDMYIIKTGLNGASGCNETNANLSTSTPNTVTGTGAITSSGGSVINPSTAVRNTLTNKAVICIFGVCSINSVFTASSSTVCQNSTVQFTNNSTGSTSRSWYLNGALVSNALNFSQTFNTPGIFNVSLISFNGASCSDSFSIQIRVNSISNSNVSASSCQQYTWPVNNQTYLQSGTFTHTVTNSNGCDSVITLNLTIRQNTSSTLTQSSCGSFTLNGQTYTQSGTYTQTRLNAAGCDSVITLNIQINQNLPSSNSIRIRSCGNYTINGQTYTSTGTYTQILTNWRGCDSILTIRLTVSPFSNTTVRATACGSYIFNRVIYTQSGTYNIANTSNNGCSSNTRLILTINQPSSSTLNISVCNSYTLNGQIYTRSGVYRQLRRNVAGCDSTITLNLTINYSSSSTLTIKACQSYTLNGQTYTQTGTYSQTLVNSQGCDSIITLNLSISQPLNRIITQTACGSYTYNGITYTQSGTYFISANLSRCQGSTTLILTIIPNSYTTLNETATGSYNFGNQILTSSGTYTRRLTNYLGCDSIITLNLNILNPRSPDINNDNTIVTFTQSDVQIFPNPTNALVTINLNSSKDSFTYKLLTVEGKVLESNIISSNRAEVNLSDYPPALYLIEINAEDGSKIIKKVIKY